MKKSLLAILAFISLVASSEATVLITIASNANSGSRFFLANGTTLVPDGSYLRIGTFASEPAADATFASLQSSFREFGVSTTGHSAGAGANKGLINRPGIAGAAGGETDFSFAHVADPGNNITALNNIPVYIWVYNEPGVAAVTSLTAQQGIFKSSTGVYIDDPLGSSTSVSTQSLLTAYGKLDTQASSVVASGIATSFRLAGVPEPSVTALLGLLGLVGLRRKR